MLDSLNVPKKWTQQTQFNLIYGHKQLYNVLLCGHPRKPLSFFVFFVGQNIREAHGYHEIFVCTLKCLSIGTPKIINFPFVSNGKLMVFRCPNIQAHCNEAVLCLNFWTPEYMYYEFSIWDKWKIYYFQVSQYLSTLG